jgi:predicted small metal-binding protein
MNQEKQMSQGMDQKLMKVSCEPECGFAIQSHDEKELIGFVENHVKHSHKMNISDKEVREKMTAI